MNTKQIQESIELACSRIAPAWSLENSIAVNPYLGLIEMPFEKAAKVLKDRGGIKLYMPINFYLKYVEEGEILNSDIDRALKNRGERMTSRVFLNKVGYLSHKSNQEDKFKELIFQDLVQAELNIDVTEIMVNHTSEWLAAHLNNSNITPQEMFTQWKLQAILDRFPELHGLSNFRLSIQSIPEDVNEMIEFGLDKLQIPSIQIETYVHTLLLRLLGWSSYCVGLDWQHQLYGKNKGYIQALLAILLAWEYALLSGFKNLQEEWVLEVDRKKNNSSNKNLSLLVQSVLQDAFDISFQRKIVAKFNRNSKIQVLGNNTRSLAQMVFCIDVRSEVYRRQLEHINRGIETIGFAGFFGFPVHYKPMNHQNGRNQCPALISSGPQVYENTNHQEDSDKVNKELSRKGILNSAWTKFKSGSVSSYSFVSPLGLFYLPKLVSDSFGWTRPVNDPKKEEFGKILSGQRKLDISKIPFKDRVNMAKSALSVMGLTKNFAPLVLITGHGASSVNNPHASGLDCGACGGNSGEINAITAQLIFNDQSVREELTKYNIDIPSDTCFVACLHNTTTDEIQILNESNVPNTHINKLNRLKATLKLASKESRKYRGARLGIQNGNVDVEIVKRSKDWGQVRPEWGLAGCHSFVVAPRVRTKGMDLEGKTFLHSYNWKYDRNFNVLEAIMTAPMIVTSWINLQYYASTVDNLKLGSGNKTLHNVTAGLGVLEGAKGDLRIGLPIQSVHDGKQFQHLPLRLKVVIEAPVKAVENIINKHSDLQKLCNNHWISIMIMNSKGQITHLYKGKNNWEELVNSSKELVNNDKFLEVTI